MERYGDEEQSAGWRKPSRRNPKGRRALRLRAALCLLMDPFHWAPQGGEPVLCMQRRFKGCFFERATATVASRRESASRRIARLALSRKSRRRGRVS